MCNGLVQYAVWVSVSTNESKYSFTTSFLLCVHYTQNANTATLGGDNYHYYKLNWTEKDIWKARLEHPIGVLDSTLAACPRSAWFLIQPLLLHKHTFIFCLLPCGCVLAVRRQAAWALRRLRGRTGRRLGEGLRERRRSWSLWVWRRRGWMTWEFRSGEPVCVCVCLPYTGGSADDWTGTLHVLHWSQDVWGNKSNLLEAIATLPPALGGFQHLQDQWEKHQTWAFQLGNTHWDPFFWPAWPHLHYFTLLHWELAAVPGYEIVGAAVQPLGRRREFDGISGGWGRRVRDVLRGQHCEDENDSCHLRFIQKATAWMSDWLLWLLQPYKKQGSYFDSVSELVDRLFQLVVH